jgi:hypothetical protein
MGREGKGEITPISRGEEIRIEQLQERAREVRQRAGDALEEAFKAIAWREELLRKESKMDPGKQNLKLVEALEKELEDLGQVEHELFETIQRIWGEEDELRERWLRSVDRSELLREMTMLEELIKREKEFEEKKDH